MTRIEVRSGLVAAEKSLSRTGINVLTLAQPADVYGKVGRSAQYRVGMGKEQKVLAEMDFNGDVKVIGRLSQDQRNLVQDHAALFRRLA